MAPQVHPFWGRPLDQYTYSYGMDAAKQRATLTVAMEIKAQAAVQKICKFADEGHLINQNDQVNEVTFSTLESVLQLALDPETFHHFARPSLIEGCIGLMATIKPLGKTSVSITYNTRLISYLFQAI
jgi:hypothetical protein